ncbi:MAG TPA: hypothetical protein DEO32_03870 [Ruminococcaceae bacterium]|nr:hypothetical protein [Oscillospiraceae bacterium]
MPDMQEQINKILSDPEALKQVQSLAGQLGLNQAAPAAPKPPAPVMNQDVQGMINSIAPLMQTSQPDSNTAALLSALRPFLSAGKAEKLDRAMRIIRLVKLIPLIKDSGIFL